MAAVDGSRAADTVVPEAAGNANEAFLVNGSLSSGLDAPGQQGPWDRFRGGDDPSRMFGGGDRGPGGASGMPSIFGGDPSSSPSPRGGRGGPGGEAPRERGEADRHDLPQPRRAVSVHAGVSGSGVKAAVSG